MSHGVNLPKYATASIKRCLKTHTPEHVLGLVTWPGNRCGNNAVEGENCEMCTFVYIYICTGPFTIVAEHCILILMIWGGGI